MFQHYIKSAWRNIKNNKLFGILNIGGLAIGIAICIPLFLYVLHEVGFDEMYANQENIYRINLMTKASYGVTPTDEKWSTIPNAIAPTAIKNIPQIKYAARFFLDGFGQTGSVKIGQNIITEKGLYWCDPEILKIFNTKFIKGNPDKALELPNGVILSRSEAKRLFGKEEAMGKIISLSNSTGGTHQLSISGIFEDYPDNSTFRADMIAPLSETWANTIRWNNASFGTYCMLNNGADLLAVNRELNKMVSANVDSSDRWYSLFLQPLSKVHLYSSDIKNLLDPSAGSESIQSIKNIALLGFAILLIACINYMNLSTARSEKYAKDVGINKTLGATRAQMIKRFYAETSVTVLFAVICGFILSFGSIFLFQNN